jgi:hypothetical protein
MQYTVIAPFIWKGEAVEPGAVITADSPEDDDLVERRIQAGKIFWVPEGWTPPPPSEAPDESTQTPPMGTADMPSHVGRRQRAEQPA